MGSSSPASVRWSRHHDVRRISFLDLEFETYDTMTVRARNRYGKHHPSQQEWQRLDDIL